MSVAKAYQNVIRNAEIDISKQEYSDWMAGVAPLPDRLTPAEATFLRTGQVTEGLTLIEPADEAE
jgi:hypothetical protein